MGDCITVARLVPGAASGLHGPIVFSLIGLLLSRVDNEKID